MRFILKGCFAVKRFVELGLVLVLVVGLAGCSAKPPELFQKEKAIEVGSEYNLLDMVALGAGSTATLEVKDDGVKIAIPGDYSVVYAVTDEKGRLFDVPIAFTVADTTPPQIVAPESISISHGESFDALKHVSADDKCDGDLSKSISVEGNVDTQIPGEYTIEYSVSDSSGNRATATTIVIVSETFSEDEQKAITVISDYIGRLKNPESLQLHNVEIQDWSTDAYDCTVKFDCSAQNGFGGMTRKTYYINVKNDGSLDTSAYLLDELNSLSALGWLDFLARTLDAGKILEAALSVE